MAYWKILRAVPQKAQNCQRCQKRLRLPQGVSETGNGCIHLVRPRVRERKTRSPVYGHYSTRYCCAWTASRDTCCRSCRRVSSGPYRFQRHSVCYTVHDPLPVIYHPLVAPTQCAVTLRHRRPSPISSVFLRCLGRVCFAFRLFRLLDRCRWSRNRRRFQAHSRRDVLP